MRHVYEITSNWPGGYTRIFQLSGYPTPYLTSYLYSALTPFLNRTLFTASIIAFASGFLYQSICKFFFDLCSYIFHKFFNQCKILYCCLNCFPTYLCSCFYILMQLSCSSLQINFTVLLVKLLEIIASVEVNRITNYSYWCKTLYQNSVQTNYEDKKR